MACQYRVGYLPQRFGTGALASQGRRPVTMLHGDALYGYGDCSFRALVLTGQPCREFCLFKDTRDSCDRYSHLSGIMGNNQRCLPRLQNIAQRLKGTVARVVRQQHHASARYPVGRKSQQEACRASAMVDRTSSLLIDRTEEAENLLAQKSAHLFGKAMLIRIE